MTPHDFIAKWQRVNLSERSACQQHFLDLCELLNQPKPAEADPEGEHYTFERGVHKPDGAGRPGRQGWADVALVVGANDVTNPAARTDKTSPLYGMPILEVDRARSIIVLKRSLRPGFAGVDNELYYDPKCMMLFGDAKESVNKLIGALKG